MAGERILVIENDPLDLKLAKAILASGDYVVRTAVDAEEALRVLGDFTPQLILADLTLPGMDAFSLVRHLCSDACRVVARVVALSRNPSAVEKARALAAGCDAYLTKPIEVEELLRVVARLVVGPRVGA